MSTTNSMTIEELLENAAADAFGLLDEYEAALYTRSFHNAPAAIQDQIIQLQATLVSDESIIPSETPNPMLRNRVLEAVNTAIEQETAQLEPLATIGRSRIHSAEIAGRIAQPATWQFWRAAAFALCAGLIVVSYFLARTATEHNEIARIALLNNTGAQLEEFIGPTLKDYLFAKSQQINFRAVGNASDARAVLFIIEGSDKAFLIVEGLPMSAQPYQLSLKLADNSVESVLAVESNGKLMGMHVAMNRQIPANAVWELRSPEGDLLLASV